MNYTSTMQINTNELSLPDGWRWVKIGDIAEVSTGGTPDTNHPEYYGGDIRWLKSGDVKGTYIDEVPNRISQLGLDKSNARIHSAGSVMLAMSGQGKTRGTSAILRVPSTCSQSVAAILPSEHAIPEIIHYALVNRYDETRRITGDDERTGLNLKIIREIVIPLPPLDEQRRIASRLHEQLAAVESARKAAEEQLHAAWQLPSAYLRDVFDVQTLPNGWLSGNLGDFAFVTKLAGFEYTEYVDYQEVGEIPVIRAQNVTPNGFKESNFVYVSSELANQLTRSQLFGGDILMVFIGAGLGNVGIVPDGKEYFLGPNVALIRPDKKVLDNKYLYYFLQSDIGRSSIFGFIKTTAQGSISMGNIRNVQVAFPSLDEQRRIANRLNEQLAAVKSVRTVIESQLAEIESLPASLLREAFAGQL